MKNNKRIFLILLITLGISGIIFPSMVVAQQKPNECCELNHEIRTKYGDFNENNIMRPPEGGVCNLNSGNAICDVNGNCIGERRSRYWGLICLVDSVMTATDWIFYTLLLVSVLMFVIGGFMFVTAAGDPQKSASGRRTLTYAAVGVGIAALSRVVPSIVKAVVGL